ncbi:MAG: hypothetical protein M3179_06020 [Actinomycetota bacterium]|nr:hypothetical protein [Actinomycetota bacterium]
MSEEVSITRLDEGNFGVEVRQGSLTTNHRVSVPSSLVDDLGLADVDHEHLVRESIAFLLEREPATSILPEFGLDIIPRYFPEYSEEVVRRVQA